MPPWSLIGSSMSKKKRVIRSCTPELAHFLGEPRRAGDIEEHYNPLLADRTMIGSQHDAGEHRAADQPRGLGYHPTTSDMANPIAMIRGKVVVNQSAVNQRR